MLLVKLFRFCGSDWDSIKSELEINKWIKDSGAKVLDVKAAPYGLVVLHKVVTSTEKQLEAALRTLGDMNLHDEVERIKRL